MLNVKIELLVVYRVICAETREEYHGGLPKMEFVAEFAIFIMVWILTFLCFLLIGKAIGKTPHELGKTISAFLHGWNCFGLVFLALAIFLMSFAGPGFTSIGWWFYIGVNSTIIFCLPIILPIYYLGKAHDAHPDLMLGIGITLLVVLFIVSIFMISYTIGGLIPHG